MIKIVNVADTEDGDLGFGIEKDGVVQQKFFFSKSFVAMTDPVRLLNGFAIEANWALLQVQGRVLS